MPKLRLVTAAVLIGSWACAGGDSPEPSDRAGAQPLAQPGRPGAAASAQLADDPDAEVLGGGEAPITEGSNTNWRPIEPWLDEVYRPLRERANSRKPAGGQQSNTDPAPDPDQPSTLPEQPGQQGQSSPSGASSGSNNSTPSPD